MDLGGAQNLNLLLTTGYGMFVARAYPAGMPLDRLLAIQAARRALTAGGVPSSMVRPTRSGESWTRCEGRLVELEAYVDHHAKLDSWGRLEAGLPILGRAHTILRSLSLSPASKRPAIADRVGPGETLEWTRRATGRLSSWPPDPLRREFVRTAESLAHRMQEAEAPFRARLPVQLVHGDFWDGNVGFRHGKVVLVTGLDLLGERARIEDLALTLYYVNSTFSDDPLSTRRIRRLRALVDAYDSGLEEPLSSVERAALPLAIARIPLSMMRYLAQMEKGEDAARPIAEMLPNLVWAASLLDNVPRWQEEFS